MFSRDVTRLTTRKMAIRPCTISALAKAAAASSPPLLFRPLRSVASASAFPVSASIGARVGGVASRAGNEIRRRPLYSSSLRTASPPAAATAATSSVLFESTIRASTLPGIGVGGASSGRFLSAAASDEAKKKSAADKPNLFLDNLGKIFLGTIGVVIVMLVRSSKSNSSKIALREDVESAVVLDPMEIDDLRTANSEFTAEVWGRVRDGVSVAFPAGKATYSEFLSAVLKVMREIKGEEFTIELGHLVDRVVIDELERQNRERRDDRKDESADGKMSGAVEDGTGEGGEDDESLPLLFLFAALSLALNSTVSDRIGALYGVMLKSPSSTTMDAGNESNASGKDVALMISYLQRTCQLVPDAQIVETSSEVPYQTYRVGDGVDLTDRARRGYGGKKGSPGVTREPTGPVSLEEFSAILKSRTVCAWGECYVKKRGRMATSDR